MRDRETIDSELRRIALGRRSIREQGGQPSYEQADKLLDERLAHRAEASESEPVEAGEMQVVADTRSRRHDTEVITPHGRKGVLRRFGPLAALPLSLLAVATVLVVMFGGHKPQPAAQPAEVPPPPPSAARPSPPAPQTQAPPLGIVDRVFIETLKQDGVPVPSHEYVMSSRARSLRIPHAPTQLRRGRPLRAAIVNMGRQSKQRVRRWRHRLVLSSVRTHKHGRDAAGLPECSH